MTIASIYEPVEQGLAMVENNLKAFTRANVPWMTEPLKHILEGGGKRIRPALTLLAGKFYRHDLEQLVMIATAVELFHTATLVHDDAVDDSAMRRGRPTVNNRWGDGIAVLLGDFLFSNSAYLVYTVGNQRVMKLFSETLIIISSGQLRQLFSAYNWQQTRQDYYEQIASKTASLLSAAPEAGALLSEAPEEAVAALRAYGHDLGMAFQIVDDILDFTGDEEEMGKPVGSDLLEGTLTLPAILLMENYPQDNPIKELFQKGRDRAEVQRVIEMVRNSLIVEECYRIAADFSTRACRALDGLPENACRRSLIDLAHYLIERRR